MNADDLSPDEKLDSVTRAYLRAELDAPIEPRPESPTLEERIAKLEEENARLREICQNFGLGIYTVEAMADRFCEWANGD